MSKRLLVVLSSMVVGMVGLSSFSYGADLEKGLIFYLPFDKSIIAKVAGGSPERLKVWGEAPQNFEKGIKNEAVILGIASPYQYRYEGKGNIDYNEGSVSFWVKLNYDNISFFKADEMLKAKGKGYYALIFFWGKDAKSDKVDLDITMTNRGLNGTFYTYPMVQHSIHVRSELFEKDRWYHLVYTWNVEEESIQLYLNGKKVGQEGGLKNKDNYEMPDNLTYDKCTLHLGEGWVLMEKPPSSGPKREVLPENFTCTMDELRIYNRVLEEDEIAELFDQYENIKL